MSHLVPTLLVAVLALIVLVLLTGVLGFARGGPWYQRNANRLMNLRVAVQAVAVLLLGAMVLLAH